MSSGLEVFNPDGSSRQNIADNTTRFLGSLNVSGTGQVAWPYTSIAGNRRFVTITSNHPIADNEVSIAWARYNPSTGYVQYSQADDLQYITLLFMTF